MSVRNEMEQMVWDELGRIKEGGGRGSGGCWCVLCVTDIVALALTMLPPLYRREGAALHATQVIRAGAIKDAVQAAVKRVGLRPKHRPGIQPSLPDKVSLVNYALELGAAMVGPALCRAEGCCSCSGCRADTLAYALNRYPAKYGVARAGRRCLHPTYVDFMRYELGMLIGQAARVVSTRPRHLHAVG